MNQNQIVGRRYQIIKELGRNAWSKTLLAKDTTMQKEFRCVVQQFSLAVKGGIKQKIQASYGNETYLWQKLSYENRLPSVLACFKDEEALYIVREYIEGLNLAQRIEKNGVLEETELISLLKDVLSTLTLIHQQDVVHQDLKPSNLIIRDRDRQVFVIGFSAIETTGNIGHTIQDTVLQDDATALVSAKNKYYPEKKLRNQPAFKRDIYALGAIATEAVTGKKPSQIPAYLSIQAFLAAEASQLTPRLRGIIEGMMDLDSAQGYISSKQVLNELNNTKPALAKSDLLVDPTQANSPTPSTTTNQPQDKLREPRAVEKSPAKTFITTSPKKRFGKLQILGVIVGVSILAGIGEFFFPLLRPRYQCYQGDKNLAAEQPSDALARFKQATELNSRSVCGWLGQGKALYGLERYRAALAAYDRVEQIQPDLVATWQGRGEVLYRLERFEAANTAYNKTLKMQPNNAEVWNRKGKALYKLELYPEALAAQNKAVRLKPDYIQARSDRGIALIGLGKYPEALEAFNQAQEVDPLDPTLWQNKALVLQYLGRTQESIRLYQEALEAYERVIAENPENITALLDKANVLSKLRRHQEALDTYERVLTINQDSHLAWLGKGNALFALRKYPEALAAFDRTVRVQPKSYISWHNRGSLLRDGIRNLPEAIASYDQSLKINPNFYHAWRDRGVALSQNQQHEEAIKSFQTALKIEPDDYQSWVGRGIALSSLGRIEEAISVMDRAVEIQPKDPFVWMNRAAVLERGRRYTEACDAYREVKKINPGFPPAIQKFKQLGCRQ